MIKRPLIIIIIACITIIPSLCVASTDSTHSFVVDTTIDGIYLKGDLGNIFVSVMTTYYYNGDNTTARKYFEAIAKATPNKEVAFVAEGYIVSSYGNEGLWDEALNRSKKMLEKETNPEHIQRIRQGIAVCYMRQGKWADALAIFKDYQKNDLLKADKVNKEWLEKQIQNCEKQVPY
jgi:tetratricopeptide (TPR) repeat protein